MRFNILIGLIGILIAGVIARQVFISVGGDDIEEPSGVAITTDEQLLAAYQNGEPSDVAALPIPELPFADNPDPLLCGIPTPYGTRNNTAWLTGEYEGDLLQPVVYLYRDHLREEVIAIAPHGAEVEIVLYQSNPQLDYFMVRIPTAPVGQREGWVPAPFLSFEPVDTID